MQTDSNRPLQKSDMTGRTSLEDDVLGQARAAVTDALILDPKILTVDLVEALLDNADPTFAARLSEILTRDFYRRTVMAERRKISSANRVQLRLPGFEHLPLKVSVVKGKPPIRLLDANFTGVRAYYWGLMRDLTNRKRNDPKIKEAKALMEKMRKRNRKDKGITVREVVLIDR